MVLRKIDFFKEVKNMKKVFALICLFLCIKLFACAGGKKNDLMIINDYSDLIGKCIIVDNN